MDTGRPEDGLCFTKGWPCGPTRPARMWLCTRRLQAGSFAWPSDAAGQVTLTTAQFDWLVAGLPWQRLSASAKPITVI